jgi:uncharacterized repeat protein (TIGR03847 family)
MARQVLQFRDPDRFVVGTVGMPGERTFFLQARQGSAVTSVVIEKQQAIVLAERIDQLLNEVHQLHAATGSEAVQIPEQAPPGMVDGDALDVPIVEEFRVGAMALGWDDSAARLVVEAHAITEDEDVPEIGDDAIEGPDTLRVWLDPARARAFAERTRAVVSAGRPPCPFCAQPLDPAGHVCPRANGYRRRG